MAARKTKKAETKPVTVQITVGDDRLWHVKHGDDNELGTFHTLSWAQHAAGTKYPGVPIEVSRTGGSE